jgi:hypothetical protein
MRRALISIAMVAVSLTIAVSASALDIGKLLNNPRPPENFNIIHVSQLEALLRDSNSHVHIYDANHWALRTRAGMIPGARPLSSADHFDVADELPTDKNATLVFYCADLH